MRIGELVGMVGKTGPRRATGAVVAPAPRGRPTGTGPRRLSTRKNITARAMNITHPSTRGRAPARPAPVAMCAAFASA